MLVQLRAWCYSLIAAVLFAHGSSAAQLQKSPKPPWTEAYPRVALDVAAGQPLTMLVIVPLCDSAVIACGGQGAGDPGSLDRNLYWGRAFGARRFFDESARQFRRVSRSAGDGALLEQLVYRRSIPGQPWGLDHAVEQLVVLRAMHGAQIDQAVRDFYRYATQGAEVAFVEQGIERRVPVHTVGYAGHNRLMEHVTWEQVMGGAAALTASNAAVPAFVFACRSAPYFTPALSNAGSHPLVMTRDLMAPEGYIIDAMARGLGERASAAELRQRVVATYARWQRIPERIASRIFAPAP